MKTLVDRYWKWALYGVLGLVALTAIAGWILHEPSGFMSPIGPIAELQRVELIWASILILFAIAPVLIGTPWIMHRYRRDNTTATYRPAWDFNTPLEIAMWGVPVLITGALSVWLAQAVYRIDPYREIDQELAASLDTPIEGEQVRIDVIGLDWKWLFIYPDLGVASVGEMVIPVHSPVGMRLTTDTVMQSFMSPRIGGQIYTMAGMVTRLNLIADEPGTDFADNTQYTGVGRTYQRAIVRAVPADEFEAWLARAEAAPILDESAYAEIARAGTLNDAREHLELGGLGPILFRLEAPELLERVAMRYMSGEPVLPEAQPGSPSYDPAAYWLPDVTILQAHRLTHPNLHTPVE